MQVDGVRWRRQMVSDPFISGSDSVNDYYVSKPPHGGCSDQAQTELLIREQDLVAPHWVLQWLEILSFR